jgi:hypothetical protein
MNTLKNILKKAIELAGSQNDLTGNLNPASTSVSSGSNVPLNREDPNSVKSAAIKIKPSHKGLLHQSMGVPEGEKIPAAKLEALKAHGTPAERRRANFALNARKWHHKKGSDISVPGYPNFGGTIPNATYADGVPLNTEKDSEPIAYKPRSFDENAYGSGKEQHFSPSLRDFHRSPITASKGDAYPKEGPSAFAAPLGGMMQTESGYFKFPIAKTPATPFNQNANLLNGNVLGRLGEPNASQSINLGNGLNNRMLQPKKGADAAHPGLWANIRAKRARGGKPAKPGDEAYPDKKNWNKLTHKKAGEEKNKKRNLLPFKKLEELKMPLRILEKNKQHQKEAGEGSIPDVGAPHTLPHPMDPDQAIMGVTSTFGNEPVVRPKPTPFPVSTPDPKEVQKLINITKDNEPDIITPAMPLPAPKPTPSPIHPHIQQPAAVGQKLGMYLEALKKLAAANVVMHKEDKSPSGGLTQHGRDKYNRATGSHLKAPVTQKNPTGKAKARRASFCARMRGVKGPMKDEHGSPTRKALALRKWNCH